MTAADLEALEARARNGFAHPEDVRALLAEVKRLAEEGEQHRRIREANGSSLQGCAQELNAERQKRLKEQEMRLEMVGEIARLKEELRSARLTLVSRMEQE